MIQQQDKSSKGKHKKRPIQQLLRHILVFNYKKWMGWYNSS